MSSWRRTAHRIVAVIAAVYLVACGSGDGPGSDRGGEALRPGAERGDSTVALRIANGTAASEWCALLAETDAQRSRGLMEREDLGDFVGMVFRFDRDTDSAFHMTNTPLPLSIAWFDKDGRFVSATDMEPCLDQEDCPRYRAAGPYRYALEVPQGDLAELGVGEGSVLSLQGTCEDG